MKKFLKTVWGKSDASTRFSLTPQYTLANRADDEGLKIIQRLRLVCPDSELLSFFLSDNFFATVSDAVRLIQIGQEGKTLPRISLKTLRVPQRRNLLRFALEHPAVFRETTLVFPELFKGNPIALLPNNGDPLLCSPPAEMLRGRPVRVMAVESRTQSTL